MELFFASNPSNPKLLPRPDPSTQPLNTLNTLNHSTSMNPSTLNDAKRDEDSFIFHFSFGTAF